VEISLIRCSTVIDHDTILMVLHVDVLNELCTFIDMIDVYRYFGLYFNEVVV